MNGAAPNQPAVEPHEPTTWEIQWAAVPDEWRSTTYATDQPPYNRVFVQFTTGTPAAQHSLGTPALPRIDNEIAWAVHTIWREGLGKISATYLRQFSAAVTNLTHRYQQLAGRNTVSLVDLRPLQIVHEADLLFEARNGRAWDGRPRTRFIDLTERIHRLVASRCVSRAWWTVDVWDLNLDPRIPRREHEPYAGSTIKLASIRPRWLREGVRYWLATSFTYQTQTWSTGLGRSRAIAASLGAFAEQRGITNPALTSEPTDIRPLMAELLAWLREPNPTTGKRRSPGTIAGVQTAIQSFYTFMFEHSEEAVRATQDPNWGRLTAAHTRLWPPDGRSGRQATRPVENHRWLSREDLQQMVACLPILSAPVGQRISVTIPGGRTITTTGHGDPQTMRAWLLQAMTGRRKSEILMLDFDPLIALDGIDPDAEHDDTAFVARMRYQQTKIDQVDAVILIESPVVQLIREQQLWARSQVGRTPKYLFLAMRENLHGTRPRGAESYAQALHRLDEHVQLVDQAGAPLRFTQTHRLRHTRATELINAGVPIHVVQRYLGHRSPEMTMRYAATLATVAEAEFLRYKQKVGSDGRELGIDPLDLYEMAQLDTRTDRILPNGYCLLPPAQTCGRGNACLSCGHFATDASQLESLGQQLQETRRLIQARQDMFTGRHGQPMGPAHVWLVERNREVASLEAIINRLSDCPHKAIQGAGAHGRQGAPAATDGAHDVTLTGEPS